MTEKTLNLRGLKCPLPALRTRKALGGMQPGDILIVECTDPLAGIDIPNLLNQTGDTLEDTPQGQEAADVPHPEEMTHYGPSFHLDPGLEDHRLPAQRLVLRRRP